MTGREAQSRGFCSLHMLNRPLVSRFPIESDLFFPWGLGPEQRASRRVLTQSGHGSRSDWVKKMPEKRWQRTANVWA